ncbi:MAG TPA: hypothetical protein VK473_02925 [Terriglobales bacterium]|nr:hypothetical protein [Terriglobales bacterium]
MGLMDQLADVLKQYSSGATQSGDVTQHFEQAAQAMPSSAIADGLAAAFRSNQTPAFGNMLSSLFSQSNGDQRAGLLNQLISALGPTTVSQVLGGTALAGLLSGGASQITAAQAQQISPDAVQTLAEHAEKADPSIIDKASSFYAQHPQLVKTLGGAALTIAMAKLAQRQAQG